VTTLEGGKQMAVSAVSAVSSYEFQ
jgi:hypothetical protein